MDEQRAGERVARATTVYEYTRMVQERLYDIGAELNAPEFEEHGVADQAKELLETAQDNLRELSALMRHLHMRPSEDSSTAPLDTDEPTEFVE